MQRSAKRVTVVTGVAAAAAAGTAALFLSGSPALAEDPTPAPSASASADREELRQQRADEFAAALAAELGVDKEKVAAAVEKVREAQRSEAKADRLEAMKTRLAEAVKDGKLTQEQADAILDAAESGVLRGGPSGLGGPGGLRGPGWGGHGGFPGR